MRQLAAYSKLHQWGWGRAGMDRVEGGGKETGGTGDEKEKLSGGVRWGL